MAEDKTHTSFPETRWTMVLAVRDGGNEKQAASALADLCRIYWRPLYAYARKHGMSPHDAEDMTQGFMVLVLERNLLATADADRGRLRSLLLTAFNHHMSNVHRTKSAIKRGGGQLPVSIESLRELEQESNFGVVDKHTPEALFERQCALEMVGQVMTKLRSEQQAAGRELVFDKLSRELHREVEEGGARQQELAEQLGMSYGSLRQALHRLRKRFRLVLREMVRDTLHNPTEAEVDQELRELCAALES